MTFSFNSVKKVLKVNSDLMISTGATEELRRLLARVAKDVARDATVVSKRNASRIVQDSDVSIAFWNVLGRYERERTS